MAGLTPGMYVTRSARYEVQELPGDAVMTHAAGRGPTHAGTTPPGRGPDPDQVRQDWDKEPH